MHPTLEQQLKRFFLNADHVPQNQTAWLNFLQMISATYAQYERDRIAIERSLEANSQELNLQNEKLQHYTHQLFEKVNELSIARAKDLAILTSIGEGVIVTDEQGKIMVVNKKARTILGLSFAELMNKKIFEAFFLYDKEGQVIPAEKRPMFLAMQTKEKKEDVYIYRNKENVIFYLNISTNPVIQGDKIVGIITIIRDITEQKAVERLKTEFISLASHQLRTPLSAVRWFSEMLLEADAGQLNSEQKEFVQNIYDSTERMIELVNSLLNIARVESGRMRIVPKPTELKLLIDNSLEEFKEDILKKELHVAIQIEPGLPTISIDPRLIREVFSNLLSNAVKYTPKNGQVGISVYKEGEHIISQITDTGLGIPQEQQSRLFEKFFRGDNAAKAVTEGTGLGLYLAKIILESSQGRIWFKSEEGKGTTFWFSLPIAGMLPKAGEVTLD